jgi:hypothetical protein
VLFLLRTSLGLLPEVGAPGVSTRRRDLAAIADLSIEGLFTPAGRANVRVQGGEMEIVPS